MKHLLFYLLIFFFISAGQAQKVPSRKELQQTAGYIENLLKRDSINNLIIAELEQKVDSLKGGSPDTASKTPQTVIPITGGAAIPITNEEDAPLSLLGFMAVAFSAGLLALLTPCVFPMIPLTVTFFTSTSTTKRQAIYKALFYGFSIILIYTIIGLIISATLGPGFATFMSVHWVPNIIFFLIFVVFGLSFLGLFEINLPTSFVNRVDQQAEKGGWYGVFFMAFTLVLVSFSCTGPIVGSIIVQAFQGEKIRPLAGMLAYSIAFAIPFTIFAMFPQLLAKLPKSGGWLNVIKVTLGFIELALALKFLSMIDQVYHLNLLDREIYIAFWLVIAVLLGLYLLGKFRLPHDTEIKVVSVPRLIFAMFPFVFAVYLFPGMFGAPLKALSGYMPPMYTHDFDLPAIIREYSITESQVRDGDMGNTLCDEPKHQSKFRLPHGLKGYFEYEQAMACAKEKGLPLFVDFTGHGCVNCREVEANIWSDPQVLKKLKYDYIIVSLYVDDFTKLPKEEQYVSQESGLDVETIGEKNFDLEQTLFGVNSQPYYVLIDPFTGKKLVDKPKGYVSSVTEYLEYLEKGIRKFEELHPKKVNSK